MQACGRGLWPPAPSSFGADCWCHHSCIGANRIFADGQRAFFASDASSDCHL